MVSCRGYKWDCPANEVDRLTGLLIRGEIDQAVEQFKALEIRTQRKTARRREWDELIRYAEGKLQQCRAKAHQLEALVRDFKARQSSGEPTPLEVADLAGMVRVDGKVISADPVVIRAGEES